MLYGQNGQLVRCTPIAYRLSDRQALMATALRGRFEYVPARPCRIRRKAAFFAARTPTARARGPLYVWTRRKSNGDRPQDGAFACRALGITDESRGISRAAPLGAQPGHRDDAGRRGAERRVACADCSGGGRGAFARSRDEKRHNELERAWMIEAWGRPYQAAETDRYLQAGAAAADF